MYADNLSRHKDLNPRNAIISVMSVKRHEQNANNDFKQLCDKVKQGLSPFSLASDYVHKYFHVQISAERSEVDVFGNQLLGMSL